MTETDELIMRMAKHFSVTPDGQLSRDSTPYEMNARARMGVGFDRVDNGRYKRFNVYEEKGGKEYTVYSHRIIYYLYHGELPECLDHIDNDRLNNRRENLRAATSQQNSSNRTSAKNSSSKYLGVSWCRRRKKWQVNIRLDGKLKYLGIFTCEKDAASIYNLAAIEHHGEFANLNIIK